MSHNCIILNLFILQYYFIILYYIILHLTVISLLIYNLFIYLFATIAMVGLTWRGLHCGNKTILGERLVREANGGGGNTIQGLFSSGIHFL